LKKVVVKSPVGVCPSLGLNDKHSRS
jgi:hypothetical protein